MARGFRNWCFTIWLNEDLEKIWDPDCIEWPQNVECVLAGLEEVERVERERPDDVVKRRHWQGAIFFANQVKLPYVKEVLECNWAHLERCYGTRKQNEKYCTKMATAVTYESGEKISFRYGSYEDTGDNENTGKSRGTKDTVFRTALEATSLEEAFDVLRTQAPRDWLLYNTSLVNTLTKEFSTRSMSIRIPKTYIRRFFTEAELTSKSILITGKAGCGKTEFALDHFKYPCLISHMEDLKKINDKTDGLVFDDMSFHTWNYAQQVIHMLDLAHDRSIKVLYGTVVMKKGMPRIFTCNREFNEWIPQGAENEERQAIKRRIITLKVHKCLF